MKRLALSAASLTLLSAWSCDAHRERAVGSGGDIAAPEVEATEAFLPSPAVEGPESARSYSPLELCKAGIAVVMGRDPGTMAAREQEGVVSLSYQRADDNTTWSYRCRVEGGRIVWASDTGRWRTHHDDGVLTYSIGGAGDLEVTETYSDGSSRKKAFSAAQLGS